MKLEWVHTFGGNNATLQDRHKPAYPNRASAYRPTPTKSAAYTVDLWDDESGLWVRHQHTFATLEEAKAYAVAVVRLRGVDGLWGVADET